MPQSEATEPGSVDQLADEIQLLVDVCRLIAGRAHDPDMADELVDLADSLDLGIEKLRVALARSTI
jgi:hypothetical protein